MELLPHNFSLKLLNSGHFCLKKLRENIMMKKLRRVMNYCTYVSKFRRSIHQVNQHNAVFSERKTILLEVCTSKHLSVLNIERSISQFRWYPRGILTSGILEGDS